MRQIILSLIIYWFACNLAAAQTPIQMFWASNHSRDTFLLDRVKSTPASVAYSVRKLRKKYTGPAMRVRRDPVVLVVGGAEGDVAFDATGIVSPSSLVTITSSSGLLAPSVGTVMTLTTFCRGVGLIFSTSVYVTTWYDQSGNSGRNAIQTTASNQPRLVDLGTFELANSKASVYFSPSGLSTRLLASVVPSAMFSSGYMGTAATVLEPDLSGAAAAFGYGNSDSHRWYAGIGHSNVFQLHVGATYSKVQYNFPGGTTTSLKNYMLMSGGTPAMQLYENGISLTPTLSTGTPSSISDALNPSFSIGTIIGELPSYTGYHNGHMSEIVIFPIALSASEIAIIYNHQKTFFGTP